MVTVGDGIGASGIGLSFEQDKRIKKTNMASLFISNSNLIKYIISLVNASKSNYYWRGYAKNGWKSWGDFLGYDNRVGEILDIDKAKKVVSKLNIKTHNEWKLYAKSDSFDDRLPRDPYTYYANKGWKGLRDFLGKE